MRHFIAAGVLLTTAAALTVLPARAVPPKVDTGKIIGNVLPLLDAKNPAALGGVLRDVLIKSMPSPLHESSHNWGHTSATPDGVKWRRKGVLLVPEVMKKQRNDGTWQKTRLHALNPADNLILDIRNVEFPEPLRMTFGLFLAFNVRAEVDQHVWESGIRLYAASVRARMRVKLNLQCEATARIDFDEKALPDVAFRMHALHSDLSYENLVVEHIAGIGGDGANLFGESALNMLRQVKPSFEREMFSKANASIVRAVDTREVRVSLSNIFGKALSQLKKS